MRIDIGDQVTIVHKDFVAICKVIAARDPAIDHAECEAEECCCTHGEHKPVVIEVIRAAPRGE